MACLYQNYTLYRVRWCLTEMSAEKVVVPRRTFLKLRRFLREEIKRLRVELETIIEEIRLLENKYSLSSEELMENAPRKTRMGPARGL